MIAFDIAHPRCPRLANHMTFRKSEEWPIAARPKRPGMPLGWDLGPIGAIGPIGTQPHSTWLNLTQPQPDSTWLNLPSQNLPRQGESLAEMQLRSTYQPTKTSWTIRCGGSQPTEIDIFANRNTMKCPTKMCLKFQPTDTVSFFMMNSSL